MALPTSGESPLVIAAGQVPVGDYRMVRLVTSGATIYFNTTVQVGPAIFDPDTGYDVTIPSGSETGLKTDATFTVAAAEGGNPTEVSLLFDEGTTFKNVTATGSGKVMLSPVIRGPAN